MIQAMTKRTANWMPAPRQRRSQSGLLNMPPASFAVGGASVLRHDPASQALSGGTPTGSQPLWPRPRADDEPLTSAERGRKPREDENAADEWRAYYEGVGDGVTLCPECAREIGAEF